MEYKDFLLAFLTGSLGAALVKGIFELIAWNKKRKAEVEDRTAETDAAWKQKIDAKVNALVESQKYLLYDRIRYLGQYYIGEKEIDIDDRKILKQMHHSYHEGLGGNGDLDLLMKQVDGLPLKIKK